MFQKKRKSRYSSYTHLGILPTVHLSVESLEEEEGFLRVICDLLFYDLSTISSFILF